MTSLIKHLAEIYGLKCQPDERSIEFYFMPTNSSTPHLTLIELPSYLHNKLRLVPLLSSCPTSVADVSVSCEVSNRLKDLGQGQEGHCHLELQLPDLLRSEEAVLRKSVQEALFADFRELTVKFHWRRLQPAPQQARNPIEGVNQIIAIASGKGGVGKSTTAANVALALKVLGANVGVLDADIYGPSQAIMLGIEGVQPEMLANRRLRAITSPLGLYAIGMGNLVSGNTPMAWRGPMATGALQQMLRQTEWPDLDFLVIDMPPGTGDIHLTLAQTVPVSGSVIVTTPQDIALLDAKKGIELFRKVNIDVLGVIENMSIHTCVNCGHQEAIFGEQGGQALANYYDTQLLGRLPLKLDIRQQADNGVPSVAANVASPESLAYIEIAKRTVLQLFMNQLASQTQIKGDQNLSPLITESDD
jgi:ATP-binding protein involved in chromosome partitioning